MKWTRVALDTTFGPFYFDALWRSPSGFWAVVIQVGEEFYVGPDDGSATHDIDVGPFSSLEDACTVAETLSALNQYPKSWGIK